MLRIAIKAHALADFIVECSFSAVGKEQNKALLVSEEIEMESRPNHEFIWNLFVDGASGFIGSGA